MPVNSSWRFKIGIFLIRFLSLSQRLHSEHAESRFRYGRIECRRKRKSQYPACFRRRDNSVIPKAGRRIIWVAFVFELVAERLLEFLLLDLRPLAASRLDIFAPDRCQHTCR